MEHIMEEPLSSTTLRMKLVTTPMDTLILTHIRKSQDMVDMEQQ